MPVTEVKVGIIVKRLKMAVAVNDVNFWRLYGKNENKNLCLAEEQPCLKCSMRVYLILLVFSILFRFGAALKYTKYNFRLAF